MKHKFTEEELNKLDSKVLVSLFLSLQEQIDLLEQSINMLTEQLKIANQRHFGRKTEKLSEIEGQLSFFDEAEAAYNPEEEEPTIETVIITKRKKKKGKIDIDFSNFPQESFAHPVSDEEADRFFGEGCWRRMKSDRYKKLRYTPASWTVEVHDVDVVVGTDGLHQDEFLRGKHPKGVLGHSPLTPSLASALMNGKFGNAIPFYRIEKEFQNYDVNISRQTMCNWTMRLAEKYFIPICNFMRKQLLSLPVNQADETRVLVIQDGRPTPVDSWMWVHRSGEFYKDKQIILFEYQKTRHHQYPEDFYKEYKGVLVTDALQQYHMLEKSTPGITSANCWVHARREMADAVKAMKKDDPQKVRSSVAYQALQRIGKIYDIENALRNCSSEERLNRRQKEIAPLVEDFFAWLKEQQEHCTYLPKSKTGKGVGYFLNQKKYLKVFLANGDVPMDNSASERSIRPFTIGRKNWLFNNTIRGAQASAAIYSVVETAKANNLKPYYYMNYLLEEMPEMIDSNGNIHDDDLEKLMPWSKELPDECHKPAAK